MGARFQECGQAPTWTRASLTGLDWAYYFPVQNASGSG
jgi:hypothetical protein